MHITMGIPSNNKKIYSTALINKSKQLTYIYYNLKKTLKSMSDDEIPVEATTCAFVFSSLVVGACFRELNKRLGLPYTPSIMMFGMLIGGLAAAEKLGSLGDVIKGSTNIDPKGIIILFIPTLLFESAMNSDWHMFKKSFTNILALAGPGVLFNIFFTGFCVKVILGYSSDDFSWYSALALSAIISTTDPVAVVSLLKSVGAPAHFSTLVEGESLLNDGSAIVFFELFLELAKGADTSFGSILLDFISFAGGGPLFGILCGILGAFWLRKIIRDEVLTACLTFSMCYLSFYLAEYSLETSGILAVVCCGLFMAVFGKTHIDPHAEHSLHAIWAFVQWICETIIFILAGLIIGYQQVHESSDIETLDWIKMVGLFICLMIGRLAMVFLLYPLLSKSGYGLNWREAIVLCYGGLRGAISLALALSLKQDAGLGTRTKQLIVFFSAGMAAFTMLINATTAGLLIKFVKAIKVSSAKTKIKTNFMTEMHLRGKQKLEELQSQKYYELCNWDHLKTLLGLSEQQSIMFTKKILDATEKNYTIEEDALAEVRYRLLKVMKRLFWESYEEGQLTSDAIMLLSGACDLALDQVSKPIQIWDSVYGNFLRWRLIGCMQKIKKVPCLSFIAKRYIAQYLSQIYQVTTTFILVCESMIENQDGGVLGKAHFLTVINELKTNLLSANNYLVSIEDLFADTIKAIQIRRAAFHIIRYQIHVLDEALNEGHLESNEYNELRSELDRKALRLENIEARAVWSVPTFDDFVVQFPVFSILSRSQSAALKAASQSTFYMKGQNLYTQGIKATDLFVITKGVVREFYTEQESSGLNKGIGSILSFANVVEKFNIALNNCVAEGYIEVRKIPIEALKKIMKENIAFEEYCYKNALTTFVRCPNTNCGELAILDDQSILEYAQKARIVSLRKGQTTTITQGAVIFQGCLATKEFANKGIESRDETQEKDEVLKAHQGIYEPVSYIPKMHGSLEALEDTKLLVFQTKFNEFAQEKGHSFILGDKAKEAPAAIRKKGVIIETRGVRSKTINLNQMLAREQMVSSLLHEAFQEKPDEENEVESLASFDFENKSKSTKTSILPREL